MDGTDQIAQEIFRDSTGAPFDAAIHVAGKDGNPKKNKDGKFRQRRAESRLVVADAPTGAGEPSDPPAAADLSAQNRALGAAVAQTIVLCGVMLGGAKWNAQPAELEAMSGVWANYLDARGFANVPPEMLLIIGMTPYLATRVDVTAAGGLWLKTKNFFRRMFGRRRIPEPEANAHAHNWSNGLGQNDARDGAGAAG